MQQNKLPEKFAQLEPYVSDWALPTEHMRMTKRVNAAMSELQAYYDAVGPRMREIAKYLDAYPMGALLEPEQNLLNLSLMYVETAISIEFFGEPDPPGIYPRHRWHVENV